MNVLSGPEEYLIGGLNPNLNNAAIREEMLSHWPASILACWINRGISIWLVIYIVTSGANWAWIAGAAIWTVTSVGAFASVFLSAIAMMLLFPVFLFLPTRVKQRITEAGMLRVFHYKSLSSALSDK